MKYLTLSALALLLTQPASGQSDSLCMARIQGQIKPDTRITVALNSQKIVSGRLAAIDPASGELRLVTFAGIDPGLNTLRTAEINSISYRRHWAFKPAYALIGAVGFFLGGFLGQRVEGLIDSGYDHKWFPFEKRMSYEDGAWAGAISGAALSLFVRVWIGEGKTIRCP